MTDEPLKVVMRSAICGQHFHDDCTACVAARDCNDAEIARLAALQPAMELLREAREYVVDALDAHEHSDGRDLVHRIDLILKDNS